jgi:hypothetical protein
MVIQRRIVAGFLFGVSSLFLIGMNLIPTSSRSQGSRVEQSANIEFEAQTTLTQTAEQALTRTQQSYPTQTERANIVATRTATRGFQIMTSTAAAQEFEYAQTAISGALPATTHPDVWPMPMLTDSQVRQARDCDIWELLDSRYPRGWTRTGFEILYLPETPCDWAVLATAYVYYLDEEEPIPDAGKEAYLAAISGNPALLYKSPLFFGYFNQSHLVDPPPIAWQPVRTAFLRYSFGGIGYTANAQIVIRNADSVPLALGRITDDYWDYETQEPAGRSDQVSTQLSVDVVQALGKALSDLVPIDYEFSTIGCYDYYPNWKVMLQYVDGTVLHISPNGSNLLGGGGPWQVTIDGQAYMQASGAFPIALSKIVERLDMPGGATAAIACFPGADLLDIAIGDR